MINWFSNLFHEFNKNRIKIFKHKQIWLFGFILSPCLIWQSCSAAVDLLWTRWSLPQTQRGPEGCGTDSQADPVVWQCTGKLGTEPASSDWLKSRWKTRHMQSQIDQYYTLYKPLSPTVLIKLLLVKICFRTSCEMMKGTTHTGNMRDSSSLCGMCGTAGCALWRRRRKMFPAWALYRSIFSAACWARQHIVRCTLH